MLQLFTFFSAMNLGIALVIFAILATIFLAIGYLTATMAVELYVQFTGTEMDALFPTTGNSKAITILIIFVIASVIVLALSELGPVARVIGKAFILAQIGIFLFALTMPLWKDNLEQVVSILPTIMIVLTVVALIIGFILTPNVGSFLLDSPVLSILSAIPASILLFDYILLMKTLLLNESVGQYLFTIDRAKESLTITLIAFAVFAVFEGLILVKKKL